MKDANTPIGDMGGLQLFVDLMPIGQVIQPDIHGCKYDDDTNTYECDAVRYQKGSYLTRRATLTNSSPQAPSE